MKSSAFAFVGIPSTSGTIPAKSSLGSQQLVAQQTRRETTRDVLTEIAQCQMMATCTSGASILQDENGDTVMHPDGTLLGGHPT
jgi:hypothetical protein